MPRQKRRSRRGLQGKLSEQAEGSKLLRLLLSSIWFRLAALGIILVFIGLGVALVPIIETSPEGSSPVYRVSGLNIVQAWRLQKNAQKATDGGDFEGADYFWRAALRKNPGDVELVKGALNNAMSADTQELEWLRATLDYAKHYLSLSLTNEVSIEFVANYYEKRNLTFLISNLLETRRADLTPRQQQILLKAFFLQRKFAEFKSLWTEMDSTARIDRETSLYHSAFLAGWGTIDESVRALKLLRSTSGATGEHQLLASQLLLSVYGQNRDVEHFGEELAKLRATDQDAHFHNAAYWVLLFEASRPNVARHQAEDYWMKLVRDPVTSPRELAIVARAYDQIGLAQRALDLFESFDEDYAASADYWAAYGSVLVNGEKWDALRVLALKIRNDGFSSRVLRAYSYYLDGLAEAGQGKTFNAGQAFDAVIEAEAAISVDQAIEMAWEVYGIGYPEIASKLLVGHRADLELNLKYWEITFASAYKLKRADLILEAAKRMMTLDSNNVVSLNNYAAALLVRRERPEEAIRYTLQLISNNGTSPGFVLNHGLALLQNGRTEEAESHFRALPIDSLRPELATSLGLAWFELYHQTQNREKAEKALLDVSEDHLFPEQKDWLEMAKKSIGIGIDEIKVIPSPDDA
jgi:tetratricopeptide (TPR) repeat protein